MNTKISNTSLNLTDLQQVILSTCSYLNRPIRKSQLVRMVTELFECNTAKQVEFAILNMTEQKQLLEIKFFIVTPEFASKWNGVVTAADEGIIRFLLSSKEEAKNDLFFNVYAPQRLTVHGFFKYIGMKYPSLLRRGNTALALLDQMENTFPYVLNQNFYVELNDYPQKRWFTEFFDNPDCRILVKNMFSGHQHFISFQIVLLSGKNGSFKKADQDFKEFREKIPSLFISDAKIQVRKSLSSISSRKKRKKNT